MTRLIKMLSYCRPVQQIGEERKIFIGHQALALCHGHHVTAYQALGLYHGHNVTA